MDRRTLTDGSGRWYDANKAVAWDEETEWDGSNRISCATGSQWDHERLWRTAGGLYVLAGWSQWQGRQDYLIEISPKDAARWLSRQGIDEDIPADLAAIIAEMEV